jgi:5-deoxy-glucuronate isomerase
MKRHYKPESESIHSHTISPGSAGWKYLSFRVVRIDPQRTLEEETGDQEVLIVPLTGHAVVAYEGQSHAVGREDLFRELTDVVYLPPRTRYRITTQEPFEVAIGGAPALGKLPPRLIRCEEMQDSVRGDANVKRGITTVLDSDQLAERLTVYEVRTPSGNWSSFPSHRHDARLASSYHEETYYYRLSPANGFALQRIYSPETNLDLAMTIRDGDLVLVHEGYHPVVNAPGTNAYYLNFLCGDLRKIAPVNDPDYDWVAKQWDGNPIPIPVRTGH